MEREDGLSDGVRGVAGQVSTLPGRDTGETGEGGRERMIHHVRVTMDTVGAYVRYWGHTAATIGT